MLIYLSDRLMCSVTSFIRFFAVALLFAAVSSCENPQNTTKELVTIDVGKIYHEPMRSMMLSEVVEDIEYVKLETRPECMIDIVSGIGVSEHYLVIFDIMTKRLLLFSKEGKYLYDVGVSGEGADEHIYVEGKSVEISPDEKFILFKDYGNTIYLYNIDGSFHKKISAPAQVLDGFGYLKPEQLVAYQQMFYLPESGGKQLLIYDENLKISDSLIFSIRDTVRVRDMYYAYDNFTLHEGNMYFRQKLNDTIFRIDAEKSITAFFVASLGDLRMPSLLIPWEEHKLKFLHMDKLLITQNFYFFTLLGRARIPDPDDFGIEYLAYNKSSGEAFFLEEHPESYFGKGYFSYMPINDMNGLKHPEFIDFSKNGIYADALRIGTAKPFVESEASDSDALFVQKYYKRVSKLLNKSDLEDNPVIRIFYLK